MKVNDEVMSYFVHDAINGFVLLVDLVAHIQSHGLQIPDDAAHLFQVSFHLLLPIVISYPDQRCRKKKHISFKFTGLK